MNRVTTIQPTQTAASAPIAHEKIAQRAFEKWCQRGRQHGTHVQDWLDAERELRAEHLRSSWTPTWR